MPKTSALHSISEEPESKSIQLKPERQFPAGCSVMRMDRDSRPNSPNPNRGPSSSVDDDDIGLHCTDDLDNMYESLDTVNRYGIEEAIRQSSNPSSSRAPSKFWDPSVSVKDVGNWDDMCSASLWSESDCGHPHIMGLAPPRTSLARKFAYAIIFIGLGIAIGMFFGGGNSAQVVIPSKRVTAKPYYEDKATALYGNETLLTEVAIAHGLEPEMAKNFATGDACWMEGYGEAECCSGFRNCWGKDNDGIIYTFEACCGPKYH